MLIQWFPGHMTKAIRQTEEDIKLCDGVIYVLDARAPFACINDKAMKIFSGKPIVYCINKTDLISKSDADKLCSVFRQKGLVYELIDGLSKKDIEKLKKTALSTMKEKDLRDRAKGIKRTRRFMIAGIPNTGKSTIINTMSGSKKADTGDKAGVTRSNKWIRLSDIELLDTPGTTPPSFENQGYAKHLAYIGALNDDILDAEELSLELIKELKVIAPTDFMAKYKLTTLDKEPLAILEDVCKSRGFVLRGAEIDYERGAKAIIDDLRKGRIGKICFENNDEG